MMRLAFALILTALLLSGSAAQVNMLSKDSFVQSIRNFADAVESGDVEVVFFDVRGGKSPEGIFTNMIRIDFRKGEKT